MSDDQLIRQLSTLPARSGWGASQVLRLNQHKVFVKRVPITDKELANPYSTKNLYQLPTYYNYGVGSAGFNVFREILGHVKTSNWVLAGESAHFPLLHHHRIVRGSKKPGQMEGLGEYVKYWNGSRRIGRYLEDKGQSTAEVLIFLEHFPRTAGDRQKGKSGEMPDIAGDMMTAIRFLQSKKVIHFDAHMMNVVMDSERSYLTDYGLMLDLEYELSNKEKDFFRTHKRYDEGQLLHALVVRLARLSLANKRIRNQFYRSFQLSENDTGGVIGAMAVNLEPLVNQGMVSVDDRTLRLLVQNSEAILLMNDFFARLRGSSRKTYPFPGLQLNRLLRTDPI